MTIEIILLLALLVVALVLFATEVVSVDVTGLTLLIGLYAFGLVSGVEAFQGFGNQVIIFLGSLFVVTEGLVRSGAFDRIEQQLAKVAERRAALLLVTLTLGVALLSAFLSNTATMAATLPLAMGLSRHLSQSPSKILMPLAFGSILGGTCTLIGTSTNVVVSGMLPRYGLDTLSLFELAPVGLPILAIGIVYMTIFAPRLLPDTGVGPIETYGVRPYLGEVVVPEGSPWVGKTLRETATGRDLDINILGLIPAEGPVQPLRPSHVLRAGEVLLARGSHERLIELKERKELDLRVDEKWGEKQADRVQVHELLLAPYSQLAGRTLEEGRLRDRFGVTVLAIYRRGEALWKRLARIPLRDGDVLLVQGDLERLAPHLRSGGLILLEQVEFQRRGRRALIALGVFAAMIVVGGLGWVPFAMASLIAASLMVVTGCLDTAQAYAAIQWRILVLVGCLLAFATAMETSGTAQYLADLIVGIGDNTSPVVLLAGFYLLTVVLTQPMSNQAAALVVLPLAIQTATELGFNPRAFAITICIAASCSFITPLEPASLLVYGPGGYRFRDFFFFGIPLTLICLVTTLVLVPRFWPL